MTDRRSFGNESGPEDFLKSLKQAWTVILLKQRAKVDKRGADAAPRRIPARKILYEISENLFKLQNFFKNIC